MIQEKTGFSSRLGFILAAAGSAVGLGNIWRFPYLAAQYGGRTFLITYILISVTFGFALMITEIAIGRKTGKSAINAFGELSKKWSFVGPVSVITNIFVLSFYCVVGGWVAKYALTFIMGNGIDATQAGYFEAFMSGNPQPFVLGGIFILLTVFIVMLGVKKGIEKVGKVLMPTLVVLLIAVAIYIMTVPGAIDGVIYYVTPHRADFSFEAVLAAMGQVFFSMSLATGIHVTFGSYMNKKDDIEKSTHQVELFDIGLSILAGLIVVPAVFVISGGDAHAVGAGPELLFVTLPGMFTRLGIAGDIVGAVFFILVFFAAVTSCMSMFEVSVSGLCDRFKMSRKKACLTIGGIVAVGSTLCTMGYGVLSGFSINGMNIFDTFDFIASTILMPVVAVLTCILVGHITGPDVLCDEIESTGKFRMKGMYRVVVKYVAPVMITAILITGLLSSFGVISL